MTVEGGGLRIEGPPVGLLTYHFPMWKNVLYSTVLYRDAVERTRPAENGRKSGDRQSQSTITARKTHSAESQLS